VLFLMNWRTAVITLSAIPLSFVDRLDADAAALRAGVNTMDLGGVGGGDRLGGRTTPLSTWRTATAACRRNQGRRSAQQSPAGGVWNVGASAPAG